jgi:hypothetical protein
MSFRLPDVDEGGVGAEQPRQLVDGVIALGRGRDDLGLERRLDLVMDQPAVMDLNRRAAGFGMKVLRHLLQPFLLNPLPVMILENMVTYSMKAIREPRALNPRCLICQANRRAGYGDCALSLGLDKSAVLAITGDRPE